jgi:hypothetical protein
MGYRVFMFNTTFNSISFISWRSVLLVEDKTDCHDITEILLKVALNTITITLLEYECIFVIAP